MSSSRSVLCLFIVLAASPASMCSTSYAQLDPHVDLRAAVPRDTMEASLYLETGVRWVKFTKFVADRVLMTPHPANFGPTSNPQGCGGDNARCFIGGFMYLDDDETTGDVEITTLYGLDVDHTSLDEAMTLTGFMAATPEAEFSEETYIGESEEFLAASLGTFAIGDLATNPLFAGFDMSRFVGDPTSLVYAFRATAPIDAFAAVPEPSSAALLLAALFAVCSPRLHKCS